ncbi:MAG TPA: PIN domain-containing protein [Solirubrobacteraceae bacterium]|nr:PIN domain-containing protein [Solirubrobacteraceae bacterium]
MTPDTSVVVAAAGQWHPRNVAAFTAVEELVDLIDHVELEAYSVLTRIPEPFRALPHHVTEHLDGEYPGERLMLSPDERRRLLGRLADGGVSGGAAYDALVASTAAAHERTLLTLDERAAHTYARMGARVEFL